MTHRITAPLVALSLLVSAPVFAADPAKDVEAATQQWIAAFNRKSAPEIVALYAKDAVFFGTTSPILRDSPELVRDYFKNIGNLGASTIAMGEHRVQVFGDVAINTGFYTRTAIENGKEVKSPARFTFVYQLRQGKWMIVEHHSSAVPEAPR